MACQAPLSVGFSRQEYWIGLPCPPPGDLPNPGIEPESLTSPALTGSLPRAPPGRDTNSLESLEGEICVSVFLKTPQVNAGSSAMDTEN